MLIRIDRTIKVTSNMHGHRFRLWGPLQVIETGRKSLSAQSTETARTRLAGAPTSDRAKMTKFVFRHCEILPSTYVQGKRNMEATGFGVSERGIAFGGDGPCGIPATWEFNGGTRKGQSVTSDG